MNDCAFISIRRTIGKVMLSFLVAASLGGNAGGQTIENGSFEQEAYDGWTLSEGDHDLAPGPDGTWGQAFHGSTLGADDMAYDYANGEWVTQSSMGLPITFEATDGQVVAFHLQNFIGVYRMSQDIVLAPDAETLMWDMRYTNHAFWMGFDPSWNYVAVSLRDPITNNLLETVYKTQDETEPVDPQSLEEMTAFAVDISEFAGQAVRLEVELKNVYWLDLVLDNFRVWPPTLIEVDLDVELSARTRINSRSNGVIAVAILGSEDFSPATEIDVDTLVFGPGGATPVHQGHSGDVNGDGYWDVLVHLNVQDLGLGASSVSPAGAGASEPLKLCLEGETLDGTQIQGCKDLALVPGRN